jgi:hypothetical protein
MSRTGLTLPSFCAILAPAVLSLGCGSAVVAGALLVGPGGGGGQPARSVRFQVPTAVDLASAEFANASGNVLGQPIIAQLSPGVFQVTLELDEVAAGEPIHFAFRAQVPVLDAGGHDLAIANVEFYAVPPSQIPPGPGPSPPATGPTFRWRIDTALGIVVDVSNFNTAMALDVHLQGAESPVVIEDAEIYYDSPAASALNWQTLLTGTLAPQQTTTVDLPDDVGDAVRAAAGPAAVLVRYASTPNAVEQKGIYQLPLSENPIGVQESTWGSIKALYR